MFGKAVEVVNQHILAPRLDIGQGGTRSRHAIRELFLRHVELLTPTLDDGTDMAVERVNIHGAFITIDRKIVNIKHN